MFEVTTTYTRKTTSKEFFAFQIDDVNLLKAHTAFRKEMTDFPGCIGISYVMSLNKLALRVQVLWESEDILNNFAKSSKFRDVFIRLSTKYNTDNNVTIGIDISQTFDPMYLKSKKLSDRMKVKDAQQRLIDFITNLKQS
jgi:hypothetical protein